MLAPFVPRPRYSGGLMRSYEILRALAEVGDVTLVAFGGSSSPELEGVRGLCPHKIEILFSKPAVRTSQTDRQTNERSKQNGRHPS